MQNPERRREPHPGQRPRRFVGSARRPRARVHLRRDQVLLHVVRRPAALVEAGRERSRRKEANQLRQRGVVHARRGEYQSASWVGRDSPGSASAGSIGEAAADTVRNRGQTHLRVEMECDHSISSIRGLLNRDDSISKCAMEMMRALINSMGKVFVTKMVRPKLLGFEPVQHTRISGLRLSPLALARRRPPPTLWE